MVNKLTIIRALEPFLTRPKEELHLAAISRSIGAPHPTTRLWLHDLENEGILSKKGVGKMTLYALKLDNPLAIHYLAMAEKAKLISQCERHLVLKELVSSLNGMQGIKALVFGSAALDFEKANDIDLLIIGKVDEKVIKDIERKIAKDIHLITQSDMGKTSQALKNEIIKKHLLITGSEEFIRWMIWER